MFFYTDDKDKMPPNLAAIHRLDPTAVYLKHYENMQFLMFVASHPNTDWHEKRQAEKEITICQRKLDYWARLYDHSRALVGMDKIKKMWRGKPSEPTKLTTSRKGPKE